MAMVSVGLVAILGTQAEAQSPIKSSSSMIVIGEVSQVEGEFHMTKDPQGQDTLDIVEKSYVITDRAGKIQGPKEFSTMKNLESKDWANDIESVIVGSNASVQAYEDKNFKGTEITFAPGQRVPNLGKLDMANDIESMKISCQK